MSTAITIAAMRFLLCFFGTAVLPPFLPCRLWAQSALSRRSAPSAGRFFVCLSERPLCSPLPAERAPRNGSCASSFSSGQGFSVSQANFSSSSPAYSLPGSCHCMRQWCRCGSACLACDQLDQRLVITVEQRTVHAGLRQLPRFFDAGKIACLLDVVRQIRESCQACVIFALPVVWQAMASQISSSGM